MNLYQLQIQAEISQQLTLNSLLIANAGMQPSEIYNHKRIQLCNQFTDN